MVIIMKTFDDISYGQRTANVLDMYLPDCDEFPVYIHFHGGGLGAAIKAV